MLLQVRRALPMHCQPWRAAGAAGLQSAQADTQSQVRSHYIQWLQFNVLWLQLNVRSCFMECVFGSMTSTTRPQAGVSH